MQYLKTLMEETNFHLCPEEEIKKRIKKLQEKLVLYSISECLITSKVNNYYFSGTNQMQILLVYPDKEPILFVKRDIERAKTESPINIKGINSIKEIKEYICGNKIGLEFSRVSITEYEKFKKIFNKEFVDIEPIIADLRSIKSDYEIKLMKKAANVAERVYIEAMNFLKEGITEIEFGAAMFAIAQKFGHEGILRTNSQYFEPVSWHILSGISGCLHGQYDAPASGIGLSPSFPNSAGRKKIRKHEPIMVDFGITFCGYQVDTTRMFSLGEPDEKFLYYYNKALKIENAILKFAKENGDFLVVGVLSDFLTEGDFLNEHDRLKALKYVDFIDYAFILKEKPQDFIKKLKPDIVIKGQEFENLNNPEEKVIKEYGGELIFCSGDAIFSSIDILYKHLENSSNNFINLPKD